MFPPRCLLTLFSFLFWLFSAASLARGLDTTAGHTLIVFWEHVCLCVLCDMREEQQQSSATKSLSLPARSDTIRGSRGLGAWGPQDARSEAKQVELENGERPAASPMKKEAVRPLSFSSWSGN